MVTRERMGITRLAPPATTAKDAARHAVHDHQIRTLGDQNQVELRTTVTEGKIPRAPASQATSGPVSISRRETPLETVDLEDLGLELLLITALHEEAERLVARLPEPTQEAIERGGAFWRT